MQAWNTQPKILEFKCLYSAKEKTNFKAVNTIDDFYLGRQPLRSIEKFNLLNFIEITKLAYIQKNEMNDG